MNLDFCTYNKTTNIHLIDYSGRIDMETGLSRIKKIEEYLKPYDIPGKQIKVLMDARKYEKYSPEIHDKLAKIARNIFNKNFHIKLAVLDANYEHHLSDTEAWFTDMSTAIDWLR